jgi:hypothetical protein
VFSNAVEWFCFVLLTCFHHNRFLLHGTRNTEEAFMTFELDRESPPVVLSEVETRSCAPLNQCDTEVLF